MWWDVSLMDNMMTSLSENTFRVTGLLCGNSPVTGEFPSQRSVTRSFDVFFDLRLNKRLSEQSWGWWFETPWRSLWRHCNVPGAIHPSIPSCLACCSKCSVFYFHRVRRGFRSVWQERGWGHHDEGVGRGHEDLRREPVWVRTRADHQRGRHWWWVDSVSLQWRGHAIKTLAELLALSYIH